MANRKLPKDVQKAIDAVRNPGGGLRLVSHGFAPRVPAFTFAEVDALVRSYMGESCDTHAAGSAVAKVMDHRLALLRAGKDPHR